MLLKSDMFLGNTYLRPFWKASESIYLVDLEKETPLSPHVSIRALIPSAPSPYTNSDEGNTSTSDWEGGS